jgi:hypothetical protein
VEVAAGAEKAQALRDLTQELRQHVEEAAAGMAAASDVQDSGDTKEEGETGDEEQEAEEKGGEEKEQAGPSSTAVEGGGGCACSFSSTLPFTEAGPEDVRRGAAGEGEAAQVTGEGGRAAGGAAPTAAEVRVVSMCHSGWAWRKLHLAYDD